MGVAHCLKFLNIENKEEVWWQLKIFKKYQIFWKAENFSMLSHSVPYSWASSKKYINLG